MKTHTIVATLLATSTLSQAGLHINAGSPEVVSGQGPKGANAHYQPYGTTHEDKGGKSGASVSYKDITFAGSKKTYDVGVELSWSTAEPSSRQAFSNRRNNGYNPFFSSWVGIDTRDSQGVKTRSSITVRLTGLQADTNYIFTSYHFDSQDVAGTFTVDQSPSASEKAVSPFVFGTGAEGPDQNPARDFSYSFHVKSDATGKLEITYTCQSGIWVGINGFDLESATVPKKSSPALLGIGDLTLILRR